MFQFISVFVHYLVQVFTSFSHESISFLYNQTTKLTLGYFSSSFSKRIAIIFVLGFVLVIKLALVLNEEQFGQGEREFSENWNESDTHFSLHEPERKD